MGCGQNWNRWESNDCSDDKGKRKESAADDELRRERDLYKDAYLGLTKRIRELENKHGK